MLQRYRKQSSSGKQGKSPSSSEVPAVSTAGQLEADSDLSTALSALPAESAESADSAPPTESESAAESSVPSKGLPSTREDVRALLTKMASERGLEAEETQNLLTAFRYRDGPSFVRMSAEEIKFVVQSKELEADLALWVIALQQSLGIESLFQMGLSHKDKKETIRLLSLAAQHGHVQAQYRLARMLALGERDTEKNPERAVHWYKKAAANGNLAAQLELGQCAMYGWGMEQSIQEAARFLTQAVEQGHTQACHQLGQCYEQLDQAEAVKWYQKGAIAGDLDCMYETARCYSFGIGVPEDEDASMTWYLQAAEKGHALAQFSIASRYLAGIGVDQEDEQEAEQWFRKAADQGQVESQAMLGALYWEGRGVNKDKSEALKWFIKAAKNGHADSQFRLAECHESGEAVGKPDQREASRLFRQAAEQGHAQAQYNMGMRCLSGLGTPQDEEEAVGWFRKAAEQGDVTAQFSLGAHYFIGLGCEQDHGEAVHWYQCAAEQDHAEAQYELGQCYLSGWGVEQDKEQALDWYRKASEQGHTKARQKTLEVMYLNAQKTPKNNHDADPNAKKPKHKSPSSKVKVNSNRHASRHSAQYGA